MTYCVQVLSKKLTKLRARVESPFLFRCNLRVLKQELSTLLLSIIGIPCSLASFLRDLFNSLTLLLIPPWSLLIVSDDRTMVVCGDSSFASDIIYLIVSTLSIPSLLVKSLVPQCTRTQSGFLLIIGRMWSLISKLVAPLWARILTLCRFFNPCSFKPFRIESPIITTFFRCLCFVSSFLLSSSFCPLLFFLIALVSFSCVLVCLFGSLIAPLFRFESGFFGGSFKLLLSIFCASFVTSTLPWSVYSPFPPWGKLPCNGRVCLHTV